MTANGKITTSDIDRRPRGTVRILVTNDPDGRKPATPGSTGPWYPARNRRGMRAVIVADVDTAAHKRGYDYHMTTDDGGRIVAVSGRRTFWLAPAEADATNLGGITFEPNHHPDAAITQQTPTGAPAGERETFEQQASKNGGSTWLTVAVGLDTDDVAAVRERDTAGEGLRWRVLPETDDGSARLIAAKEAQLVATSNAFHAEADRQIGGRQRTKQFGRRVDAKLRRAGNLRREMERLEGEIRGLRRRAAGETATQPLDLGRLPNAAAIRTATGWYRVLRVNRVSVTVEVPPGWDNRIPVKRIREIREHAAEPAAPVESAPLTSYPAPERPATATSSGYEPTNDAVGAEFDPGAVRIERHRSSVTQGEVVVFYRSQLLSRFGDRVELCTDHSDHDGASCFGGFRGRGDGYWIEVARTYVARNGAMTPSKDPKARVAIPEERGLSIGTQIRRAAGQLGYTFETCTVGGLLGYRIDGRELTPGQAADYLLAGGFRAASGRDRVIVHPDRLIERAPTDVDGQPVQVGRLVEVLDEDRDGLPYLVGEVTASGVAAGGMVSVQVPGYGSTEATVVPAWSVRVLDADPRAQYAIRSCGCIAPVGAPDAEHLDGCTHPVTAASPFVSGWVNVDGDSR